MPKNDLEKIFDYSYITYYKGFFMLIKEVDFPLYLIQKSKLRFKPPQMVDRLLLSFKGNFAFELKMTQNKSITFERIRDHQISFLQEFKSSCGNSYFIFSFLSLEEIYAVEIDKFLELKNSIQKKSFNLNDMKTNIGKKCFKIEYKKLKGKRKFILNLENILGI